MITKIKSLIQWRIYINRNYTPKEFYQRWQPMITKTPLKQSFFKEIEEHSSVFEFGCHNGYNLEQITKLNQNIKPFGIDLNQDLIKQGQKKGRSYIAYGHEGTLKHFCNFDIVFTSSVLCHIEEIDDIIKEFKRIAKRRIVLIETNERKSRYYFPHNYQNFGFTPTKSIKNPSLNGNDAIYTQWVLEQ